MEKHEAGEMVVYLGKMFPRWKVTPELAVLWGEVFSRFPVTVARSAINQHRAESSKDDPQMPAVIGKMQAWREENQTVDSSRWIVDNSRGPVRSMEERCERYMVGGKEAWVIDGYEERHWPAMEAAIQCFEETGVASMGVVMHEIISPSIPETRSSRWKRMVLMVDEKRRSATTGGPLAV